MEVSYLCTFSTSGKKTGGSIAGPPGWLWLLFQGEIVGRIVSAPERGVPNKPPLVAWVVQVELKFCPKVLPADGAALDSSCLDNLRECLRHGGSP